MKVSLHGCCTQGVAGAARCGWDAAGALERIQPVGHLRPACEQPVSIQCGPAHSQGAPPAQECAARLLLSTCERARWRQCMLCSTCCRICSLVGFLLFVGHVTLQWLQAHGILMSLVWVALVPISIIVARLCRHSNPASGRPLSLTPLGFQVHRAVGCAGTAAAGPRWLYAVLRPWVAAQRVT